MYCCKCKSKREAVAVEVSQGTGTVRGALRWRGLWLLTLLGP
jgi:hypothetical protein